MRFGTIVADPPWGYARSSANELNRGFADGKYATMTVDELASLNVAGVAAETSVLLLWTTPAFSAIGADRELCEAWGFRPVTYTYWVKTTKDGTRPSFGVGYWFRGAVEPVLLGSRGRAFRTNERGAFMSPPLGHSRKPGEVHELAERHFPAPRLEMFARGPRRGWTCVGDEWTGRDVRDDLKRLVRRSR